MTNTKNTRPAAKRTALVIRPIPRNEIDGADGWIAGIYDRVQVVSEKIVPQIQGGRVFRCKNDGGERFTAYTTEIQIDEPRA